MKQNKSKNTERGIINPTGIIIEGDISLSTKYEIGKDRMLLLRTLLCILAATFTMSILGKYLGATNFTVFPVILTSLSFTALVSKNPAAKAYGIGYLLFQVTYFIIMFKEIRDGIEAALIKYQEKAGLNVFKFDGFADLSPEYKNNCLFHAMMFLAAVVAALVALSCILRTDFPIFFISTFPFMEIGLFHGWDPPSVAAVGLVICWITMLSLAIINHSTNKAGINNTFAVHRKKQAFYFTSNRLKNRFFSNYLSGVALICAAVFAVSMIFSSISGFVRPKFFDPVRKEITNYLEKLPDKINDYFDGLFNNKEIGVTNGGKLGKKDEIKFTGSNVLDLKITKRTDQTIYLRGFIAGDYKDNEWSAIIPESSDLKRLKNSFDKNADGQPIQNFNFISFPSEKKKSNSIISLHNEKADDRFIYAPYFADYLSINMDKRSKPEGEGSVTPLDDYYQMDFIDPSDISNKWGGKDGIVDQLSNYKIHDTELNKTYSEFVSKYYTEVTNSEGLEIVYKEIYDELSSEYQYDFHNEINIERITASAIADYLSRYYNYTLTPGSAPDDKDFIDHFLRESKCGYCTYFASAGTMLMRKFGFPARYVEGFIVTPDDYFEDKDKNICAQLTDKAAHAWCEVFIDNIGWVPLEFTPGYNNNVNRNDPKVTTATTTSATTTTTTAATTSASNTTTNANGSSASGTTKKQISSTTSGKVSGSGGNDTYPTSYAPKDYTPSGFIAFLKASFVYIVIFTVIIVVFFVRRRMLLKKQKKLTTQDDKSKAFLWIYIYYLKYLELINISDETNISDEAQASRIMSKCHKNGIDSIIPAISYLSSLSIEIHLSRGRDVSYEEHSEALSALNALKNDIVPERLSFIGKMAAKWIYGLY